MAERVLRINCWSGPRNISTAFMYSWAQRADTTVLDEPLYAAYLHRFDLDQVGRGHPMTEAVLASQPIDPAVVIDRLVNGEVGTPVLFAKQMAHHLRDVDTSWLGATEHIFLTRHPADMLRSLSVQLPQCELEDTGLVEQVALLDRVLASAEVSGRAAEPIVIDSAVLLADPPGVLAQLCDRLGLAYDSAMLSWPAGPKPYDGVWAPAWYANAHASTGFGEPPAPRREPLTGRLADVLADALPLYERLAEFSLGR